mgnify:CR=1 FL=1
MGYCTVDDITKLTKISGDVDYDTLQYYIDKATEVIIADLTIKEVDEVPSGSLTGTTFSVDYYPIADTNGDKTVDASDVTVYGWVDKTDPSTKEELTVSTVLSRDGKIVLASAPSSYEKVTVDYSWTPHKDINWDLVSMACAYYATYLFVIREYGLIPEKYAHGAIRFTHARPWTHYLEEYYNIMNKIRTKAVRKKTMSEMKLLRGAMK